MGNFSRAVEKQIHKNLCHDLTSATVMIFQEKNMFYQSNTKIFKIHDQTLSLKRLRCVEKITTKMSKNEVEKSQAKKKFL